MLLALQLEQFELDFPGVVSSDEEELDFEGELQRQLAQFELDFPGVVAEGDFKVEHDLQEPEGEIVGAWSEWEVREPIQKAYYEDKGRPVVDTGCRQLLRVHNQVVCWCFLLALWCLLCASCVPFACGLPACSVAMPGAIFLLCQGVQV